MYGKSDMGMPECTLDCNRAAESLGMAIKCRYTFLVCIQTVNSLSNMKGGQIHLQPSPRHYSHHLHTQQLHDILYVESSPHINGKRYLKWMNAPLH